MSKNYSYHTFLFPFLWNDGSVILRENFVRCLSDRWQFVTKPTASLTDAEMNEMYNQYHYFNAAARNAVYAERTVSAVVWEYRYRLEGETRYVIEKGERRYALAVDAIRLKLYNTGIGILLFELRNDTHPATEDILWMNNLGRGIYMPFCENGECSGCADALSLVCGDTVLAGGKLVGRPTSFDTLRLASPIVGLLSRDDYRVTTDPTKKDKHTFFIEPIIDDRMFTATYVVAPDVVNAAITVEDGEYRYLRDAAMLAPDEESNVANTLYRLIFVDDGNGLTCQNRTMMRRAMEENVYGRWLEYGTLIGITDYSLTAVSSCDYDYLVRNFRTEYVEMAVLTLVQRASLLGFERMISDSALGRRDISRLQRRYLMFQSQLLLKEVTSQQQGIELYRILRERMFIAEQAGEIRERISALFEQKTTSNELRENRILFFLAILGVVEAVDILGDWLFPGMPPFVKPLVSVGVCVAVWLYTHFRRK